jgi:hypothetical protein
MSAIETKLLEATGLKTKKSEDRDAYLKRLVTAIEKKADNPETGDEFWDGLIDDQINDTAQVWFNTAITARNESRDKNENDYEIEDFPDHEEDETESETKEENEMTDTTEDEGEVKTAKKTKAKKAASTKKAAPKEKTAKKAAATKEKHAKAKTNGSVSPRGGSGNGAYSTLRRTIIKNPQVTVDELTALLAKNGMKASKFAVSSIRSASLQFMHILKEEGCLKNVNL